MVFVLIRHHFPRTLTILQFKKESLISSKIIPVLSNGVCSNKTLFSLTILNRQFLFSQFCNPTIGSIHGYRTV